MGSIQPVIYAREYSLPLFQALLIRESSPLWNTADFLKVCYTLPTKNMEYLEKKQWKHLYWTFCFPVNGMELTKTSIVTKMQILCVV